MYGCNICYSECAIVRAPLPSARISLIGAFTVVNPGELRSPLGWRPTASRWPGRQRGSEPPQQLRPDYGHGLGRDQAPRDNVRRRRAMRYRSARSSGLRVWSSASTMMTSRTSWLTASTVGSIALRGVDISAGTPASASGCGRRRHARPRRQRRRAGRSRIRRGRRGLRHSSGVHAPVPAAGTRRGAVPSTARTW